MKPILKFAAYILFTGAVFFVACNKEIAVPSTINSLSLPPASSPSPPASQNINLKLVPFGTLSQARYNILTATAGNKILFAGGTYFVPNCYYDSTGNTWWNCENNSTSVDIYDTSTLSWSAIELSGSTYSGWSSAVTVGNKIFLAQGYYNSGRVDVYDASSNSWSIIQLPEARHDMAVVSLGSKIFFAGGEAGWGTGTSSRVDIYDNSTDSWSTASLSVARMILSGTSVGNKILFGGGTLWASPSDIVDIYDASTNTWSVSTLNQAREHPTAITLGDKAFFAGGNVGFAQNFIPVDIYDNTTQNWSTTNLSLGGSYFPAVASNNKILFFRYSSMANVYDASTNSWSIAYLNQKISKAAVIAVGNQVYMAGGNPDNGTQDQTAQVWKLEF